MKLGLTYQQFCTNCGGEPLHFSVKKAPVIDQIIYDSRRVVEAKNTAFFALKGTFRDGHQFIDSAYDQGIRVFVVSQKMDLKYYPEAYFVLVDDALRALQLLAKAHRTKFNYPVIAITGSTGKTTIKEWIYHLIKSERRVIRSPKSFNSQLGVALSLLELTNNCDVALIEAGISEPNEMKALRNMIEPNLGILTYLGRAHAENFTSLNQLHREKWILFEQCEKMIVGPGISDLAKNTDNNSINIISAASREDLLILSPFKDALSKNNVLLAIQVALELGVSEKVIKQQLPTLPVLALRLETFDGINNNLVINDTYNLDLDALVHSLEYQKMLAKRRKRIVIIGLDSETEKRKKEIEAIVTSFKPDDFYLVRNAHEVPNDLKNAVLLIKGTRNLGMEEVAQRYKLKRHKTFLEIDMTAVRHNLSVVRKKLKPKTKILAMVKAQSYGSGLEKMASYLEQQGVDYLGVAYVDEGVELRKHGVITPILVMNPEEESFDLCIQYRLEPAIYSFSQLDQFIKELIVAKQNNFPIHLKFDTGMRRLGFEPSDWSEILSVLQTQPEIRVAGVYSHLADADNVRDKRFTQLQFQRFDEVCKSLQQGLGYSFIRHLLNSEGVFNFPEYQLDMVRVGIAMFGISTSKNIFKILRPVIRWQSSISQIKNLKSGDYVGYSRTYKVSKPTKIAIVPLGYADGFRRSLGNGKGGFYIHGNFCPTVGRVCMDMTMVDITSLDACEGDRIEIIGENQTIEKLAEAMQTIPYEVLTSISKRVHRLYLE